jgi:predicted acylesterase/phospholipase RssA
MPETTTTDAPSDGGPRIALCLSGGGLRATFFHFGTVKALKRMGLLPQVKTIVSVSGGSILAAHIATNWERYRGTEADFESLEREILGLATRDLRGRILRRWFLTLWTHLLPVRRWRLGFVEHLEREYRRLFSKSSIASLYEQSRELQPPALHILATNLTSGELCSFSKRGYHIERRRRQPGAEEIEFFPSDVLPLSFAVAASSAFPPLFPPAKLRGDMLPVKGIEASRFAPPTHLLSDGGVFDNTGLEKTVLLQKRNQLDADVVLLSDAGSPFAWQSESTFTNIFSRNIRAANILMDRVASATLDKVTVPTKRDEILCCAIHETTEDSPLLLGIQAELPFVRTDLDIFSSDEVAALIYHGEHLALKRLNGIARAKISTRDKLEKSIQDRLLARVQGSGRRKWAILNFRDWATWAIVALSMASLYAAYAFVAAPLFFATQELDASAVTSNELVTQNGELRTANAILAQRVRDLTKQLGSTPNKSTCSHPSHGVARYEREFDVTRESGWRGGGYDQPRWCGDLVAMLKGEYPGAEVAVLRSSENKKNTCAPFICPQYNYSCTAHVKADPIYNERESDACQP